MAPKYTRRKTTDTHVGGLIIGSSYPIRIQTMANTDMNDVEGSVAQAKRCYAAGAELLRYTTQGMREVESIGKIREALSDCPMPLVADVHFRSDVADAAAKVVEAVRVNPGNYAPEAEVEERFVHFLELCKEHRTAIRIGVNHGSLSPWMLDRYGDTPKGIVESCMQFLRIASKQNFQDIVLSVKASNTKVMVDSVLLLVQAMDAEDMHYPLHLGVTEAGQGEDGRIKSAVGIGALLAEGIGDTVRVSLSEEPEAEIPVAKALVDYFTNPKSPRYTGVPTSDGELRKIHVAAEAGHEILVLHKEWSYPEDKQLEADILQAARVRMYKTDYISCPGCGRTRFDLQSTVKKIKDAIAKIDDPVLKERIATLKIGVMGCIVNGPGEMADADYGYVGAGRDTVSLYKGKHCMEKNIPQAEAVQHLLEIIKSAN